MLILIMPDTATQPYVKLSGLKNDQREHKRKARQSDRNVALNSIKKILESKSTDKKE